MTDSSYCSKCTAKRDATGNVLRITEQMQIRDTSSSTTGNIRSTPYWRSNMRRRREQPHWGRFGRCGGMVCLYCLSTTAPAEVSTPLISHVTVCCLSVPLVAVPTAGASPLWAHHNITASQLPESSPPRSPPPASPPLFFPTSPT